MNTKFLTSFVLLLTIFVALPYQVVRADTGPKPSMDFTFKQEMAGEPVSIVSGVLYECEQTDCGDAAPLGEFGPQRFYCDAESCGAVAYGFSPYHKIEIEFSDGKTRQSNVFKTAGFDSKYTVTVRSDDLLVEARFNLDPITRSPLWVVLCCCALIVGLLAVTGVVFFLRRRKTN